VRCTWIAYFTPSIGRGVRFLSVWKNYRACTSVFACTYVYYSFIFVWRRRARWLMTGASGETSEENGGRTFSWVPPPSPRFSSVKNASSDGRPDSDARIPRLTTWLATAAFGVNGKRARHRRRPLARGRPRRRIHPQRSITDPFRVPGAHASGRSRSGHEKDTTVI